MKYSERVFVATLRVDNLNTLRIKVGDKVAICMAYESDENKHFVRPKEFIGDVVEIDCKGRWFRVINDKGISMCCLFTSTYDNGRKLGYRILRR